MNERRYLDNNMSRYVSVCLLDSGMPPFQREAELIARYVEQLSDIPEIELREVIWEGLTVWRTLPTVAEICDLWQRMQP